MSIARIDFKYVITVWLLVIVSVGSVISAGYVRNKHDLEHLLASEAERLVTITSIAATSSIHALDEVEDITAERLLDNAFMVERMTRTSIPGEAELREIADTNGLHNIAILDKNGAFIVRSQSEEEPGINKRRQHRPEVADVLEGRADYRVIGFMNNSSGGDTHFGVVVGGLKVGAIVVNTGSEQMLAFRKAVGLGSMFREIGNEEHIRYIALQDTIGIIAASEGITALSSLREDPFLAAVPVNGMKSRFVKGDGAPFFEIVSPLVVDDYMLGLVRIGLETETFTTIGKRAARHFSVLFLIAAASAAFLFMYTMLRQNYTLLNREHDSILMDVRRMEEETRRNERLHSMGRLAAGVAHEIRNPLNSISMLVQLLGSEFEVKDNSERYRGFIASISSEIKRISLIVENFLTYARPKKLEKQPVALEKVINEVFGIVSEKAGSGSIRLRSSISPGIVCDCDIDQMKQVILNLVLNAIEATGKNGEIFVDSTADNSYITLTVTDTGGGIDETVMPNIFDPYFTTKEKGSGLGLSEVHRIVTMHGGTVTVSNTGTGAEFKVTVPLHGEHDDSTNSDS